SSRSFSRYNRRRPWPKTGLTWSSFLRARVGSAGIVVVPAEEGDLTGHRVDGEPSRAGSQLAGDGARHGPLLAPELGEGRLDPPGRRGERDVGVRGPGDAQRDLAGDGVDVDPGVVDQVHVGGDAPADRPCRQTLDRPAG